MRKITAFFLFLPFLFFYGCQKDQSTFGENDKAKPQTDESQYFTPSKEYLAELATLTTPSVLRTRSACEWIEIPANSTDALAKAVNDACVGGVIYLKAGNHTETKALTISKSVKIVGENGAVLRVKSTVSVFDAVNFNVALNPAIHILNAPRILIQNLDIQPIEGDGSTAILVENSNESAVMRCKINRFQAAVMVEKSDRMAIMFNTVVGSSSWQTAPAPFGESIVIINGKSAYISDNEVSNAVFPIWPCDEWGTCERNYTHHSLLGIILCNVPAGIYKLPSGRAVGALLPTKSCKVRNNKTTDNITEGILVIDGANNNIIENNEAARNGTYDIELTTDTYRFGFLTPLAYNNYVNVGSYPNIRIKDCGRNNTVIGGVKINTVTDPCN